MAFTIKRNDTRPHLVRQLLDGSGTPIPLGLALGVSFIMREKAAGTLDPPLFKKPCVIVDENGIVRYEWAPEDTADSGDFDGEFEIDFGGTERQTVPNNAYVDISVYGDLG